MLNLKFNYSITLQQRFFIERSAELLSRATLDSYQLRINNPKSAINELYTICKQSRSGYLKNSRYLQNQSSEVLQLIENETYLVFHTVGIEHYKKVLKDPKKHDFEIQELSRIILLENNNYGNGLCQYLDRKLNNIPNNESERIALLQEISTLSSFIFTELIHLGYTKNYLNKFFFIVFYKQDIPFEQKLQALIDKFQKNSEQYRVYFRAFGKNWNYQQVRQIEPTITKVTEQSRRRLIQNIGQHNNLAIKYLEPNSSDLYSLEVFAMDHFGAANQTMKTTNKLRDILHFTQSNSVITYSDKVLTVGEEIQRAGIAPTNYHIDGYFTDYNFDQLIIRYNSLQSPGITESCRQKIQSAIRYLRLGSEVVQIENKLINYWIGFEYLLSSETKGEDTLERLLRYFPKIHSTALWKRLYLDFHESIKRLDLLQYVSTNTHDLSYLTNQENFERIKENSDSPLVKQRCDFLKAFIAHPEKILERTYKHKQTITFQITRIYRYRNEIVHNAALKHEIYSSVGYLRYYLTFLINSMLDYYSRYQEDQTGDNHLNIEDYLVYQEILYGANLEIKSPKISSLLNLSTPILVVG